MRSVSDSKVAEHPNTPLARTREDYRAMKERIQRRNEEDRRGYAMQDDGIHRDERPEGSILLQATIMGAWWAATHIGMAAASAGYHVRAEAVTRPGQGNFKFQTITATKEA